jgi:hypothetical protein
MVLEYSVVEKFALGRQLFTSNQQLILVELT